MSEEKKDLKKSGSCEEMQEARKLTEGELKQVVGGSSRDAGVKDSGIRFVPGSGCVFYSTCLANSKAECPYGSGYAENCPKPD